MIKIQLPINGYIFLLFNPLKSKLVLLLVSLFCSLLSTSSCFLITGRSILLVLKIIWCLNLKLGRLSKVYENLLFESLIHLSQEGLVNIFDLPMLLDDILNDLTLNNRKLFSLLFLRVQTFYVAYELLHINLQLAILILNFIFFLSEKLSPTYFLFFASLVEFFSQFIKCISQFLLQIIFKSFSFSSHL